MLFGNWWSLSKCIKNMDVFFAFFFIRYRLKELIECVLRIMSNLTLTLTLSKSNRFRTRKLQNNNISPASKFSRSKLIGFWQSSQSEMLRGIVFLTWSCSSIISFQNKNFIVLLHDPSPGAQIGQKSATVVNISNGKLCGSYSINKVKNLHRQQAKLLPSFKLTPSPDILSSRWLVLYQQT